MLRFLQTISVMIAVALAVGAISAGGAEPSPPDTNRLVPITADEALAIGPGGTLTRDAAEAFVEALEFTLAELGEPASFGPDLRREMHQALAAGFGDLPPDDQVVLASFRDVWTLIRQNWAVLPLDEQQAFAHAVLATAFGEDAAGRALGSASGGRGDFESQVSDFCARHGGCGGVEDQLNSWAPSVD